MAVIANKQFSYTTESLISTQTDFNITSTSQTKCILDLIIKTRQNNFLFKVCSIEITMEEMSIFLEAGFPNFTALLWQLGHTELDNPENENVVTNIHLSLSRLTLRDICCNTCVIILVALFCGEVLGMGELIHTLWNTICNKQTRSGVIVSQSIS